MYTMLPRTFRVVDAINCRLFVNKRFNLPRYITTSSKKSDTASVSSAPINTPPVTAEDFSNPSKNKNWISYGFSYNTQKEDENLMNAITFATITIALVLGGFIVMYRPAISNVDWTVREAYLEIRRREEAGLPHIDRNYVDPSMIKLPTDEELGDTEIII